LTGLLPRLWWRGKFRQLGQGIMAVTAAQIRERLKSIKGPDGTELTASGKLSDIVVTEGKVFFSLTVEANAAPAWEAVRKSAEDAV
jgi:ATP-binding protein involved in chromosome partitioning